MIRTDRAAAIAFAIIAAMPGGAAAQVPAAGGDPRIQTVVYDAAQAIRLRVVPGFVCTVILPADDAIDALVVGDSGGWQVKPGRRGDQFYVKAGPGAQTSNLSVSTARRRYNFILATAPESDMSAMVELTVLAPPPAAAAAAPAEPAARYRVTGAARLKPLSIGDDGQVTTIEWPATMPFPAILAVDRGREMLVNTRIEGTRALIDRVWPEYVFRLDGQTARAVRTGPRPQGRR